MRLLVKLRPVGALILGLSPLILFYFLCLPKFVQGGDTSELVGAALKLYVPHPPGYPLWIWVQHLWITGIGINTFFWRAALLNTVFSILTLALIGLPLLKRPLLFIVVLLWVGCSTAFSESAILPDVFAFHGLFVAAIGFLYLFKTPQSKLRQMGIPFLFALGLAHHPTVLLLAPVVLGVAWEVRTKKKDLAFGALGLGVGLLATFVFYGSLLWFHPQSYFSWGNLKTLSDVGRHFLRWDYGVFQLAPGASFVGFESLGFWIQTSFFELGGLVAFSFWVFHQSRGEGLGVRDEGKRERVEKNSDKNKLLVWLSSFCLSLCFFLFCNVRPQGFGQEILRRFHLMPVVQMALWSSYTLSRSQFSKLQKYAGFALVLFSVPFAGTRLSNLTVIRNDSVIEEYATQLMQAAEKHKPVMVIVDNDTAYFSLRWMQLARGTVDSIFVASPSLFLNSWYLEKIQTIFPGFQFKDPTTVWQIHAFQLEKQVITPNLGQINFVTTLPYKNGYEFHLEYMRLGNYLSAGKGISFESSQELDLRTKYLSFPIGPQNFTRGHLFSQYGDFNMAQGVMAFKGGDIKMAKIYWSKCLDVVPFFVPALINLKK